MSFLRAIRRGLRDHPGTAWLVFFTLLGWVAARQWWGSAVMLAVYGPPYLWGAYERGRATENPSEQEGE